MWQVATGLRKLGEVATSMEMSHIARLLRRRKAPQLHQASISSRHLSTKTKAKGEGIVEFRN
jgi:hypothetical protein